MTRKDFELIASVLKAQRWHRLTPLEATLLDNIARQFADRLAGTNAAFQRDRFLKACGTDLS